jgi:hypothetical protein
MLPSPRSVVVSAALVLAACGPVDPEPVGSRGLAIAYVDSGQTFAGVTTYLNGAGDFDGDGDPDLLEVDESGAADEAFVWLNDGTGLGWTEVGQTLAVTRACELHVADLTNDGLDDFFTCGCEPITTYIATGGGTFSTGSQVGGTVEGCGFGDVNGDGIVDLVGSGGQVHLGDGAGAFVDGQDLGLIGGRDVCVADLDGDGDQDLATVTGSGATVGAWLGDGFGNFVDTTQALSVPGGDVRFCSGADADGDGDWDLVLGAGTSNASGGPGAVFLNAGDGSFYFVSTSGGARELHEDDFADIDGDGDLDFVSTNTPTVFTNDGFGAFAGLQTVADS